MSDEFFAKLSAQISEQAAEKAAEQKAFSDSLVFNKTAVAEALPVAVEMRNKIGALGISATIVHTEQFLSFEMRWVDRGHYRLELGPDWERANKLSFVTDFVNDDGRPFRATDLNAYTAANWTTLVFEEKLQNVVEKYASYAKRHGGIA